MKKLARKIVDNQTREREQLLAMHREMPGSMTSSTSSMDERRRMSKD